jgi:dTDP-4-amino-4,6-dideoxygalactose transaminase
MTTDALTPVEKVEKVPLMDLLAMHREIAGEVDEGFAAVLGTGAFIGGPQVGAFEREFAAYSGRSQCVGTGNGTDAVELALRIADLAPGDEVIIPANTFVATAEAVARIGGVPVCVDVSKETMLIDPQAVAAAITPRTRVLLPVHLYGQMAPMAPLHDLAREHGLVVVEDAAQAQGATQFGSGIGTGSLAAATSFYPGKNLGAYGDAGAVVTDDAAAAARMRRIGAHGSDKKYVHEEFGFNSRLDTLQAVVLSAKLKRLDGWNEQRRAAAARYEELFAGTGVPTPQTAEGNEHVWHLYVVRVPDRDAVVEKLQAQGVGAAIHYPVPVHEQPAFANTAPQGAPVTEEAAREILTLPLFPGITEAQQQRVVDVLLRVLG